MITELKTVKSKNGNKIKLLQSDGLLKNKTVLIAGVVHGDEPEGEFLVENLVKEINNDPQIIGDNKVLLIPCLNPDGKELGVRGNSNGVDLNRNFPTSNWELSTEKDSYYSGPESSSEIETKFLMEIIDNYKPDLILTLHTPYKIVNFDGPAQEIAQKISELNGYPVQDHIGYPTPGSFGTYAGIERNIPTITLELPDNTDLNVLWDQNKEALLYIISH